MKTILDRSLAPNTGWAGTLEPGQFLRVTGETRVSLVCFNAENPTERFDQARTKVYNMRLWVSVGEQLFSKLNAPMMTMIADGFAGVGRHDLQFGMCSGGRIARHDGASGHRPHSDAGHGCHDILASALRAWAIEPHEIPMPLNLFQHTEIDTATGRISPTPLRPSQPVEVDLRADMRLVVAVSACLDREAAAGGHAVQLGILEP